MEEQRRFYATKRTPDEIRGWQLEQFNKNWSSISEHVPFYVALVREGTAPLRFESWEQFREVMPIIDRETIQKNRANLLDQTRPSGFIRTTGGSTAQPVQLPSWRSELDYANKDVWLARVWFGISPSDKLFLIWGHSHQLGKGIRGRFNALRREVKDMLLGYHRASAYDLSEGAMRRAGKALLRFRPAWIMSYSVALDQFARVNVDLATEFRALKLKAVIATAESFPRSNSAEKIANLFGCRVAMEYGAVESGPVAHQKRDGQFQIFWRNWFVEGAPSANVAGTFEILLTSLYPRKFPLIRYRIGDLISNDPNAAEFDQTFSRVIGRCNDYVELPDGAIVHSEAFAHAVKECEGVGRFQVAQNGTGSIRFRYVPLTNESRTESEIRRRLGLVHPALSGVEIERVASLPLTIAGKSRTVVREAN